MKITIQLNDREAAKVDMVKSILDCSTQEAVSIIIAACKRRAIEAALQMFKLPVEEPDEEIVAGAEPAASANGGLDEASTFGEEASPPTHDDAEDEPLELD
jgi:hypothetical protein